MTRCRAHSLPVLIGLAVMLAVPAGLPWPAAAQPKESEPAAQDPDVRGPLVSESVTPGEFEGDLRTLPTLSPWKPGDPVRVVPRGSRATERHGVEIAPGERADRPEPEPLKQPEPPRTVTPPEFSTPNLSFDGISFTGYYPPDTVGDVGPNHYIQMVNSSFAVYDKSGTLLAGPFAINSIWAAAPTGTVCDTFNHGDPIVLYDHLADRWLISQFALPVTAPFYECIAISRTADPVTGGWYTYAFPAHEFPDYPKLAVWPDAYYMAVNEGNSVGVSAFDRVNMLNGNAASAVHFDTGGLPGLTGNIMLPSDLDGPPPPLGAPNFFYRQVDGEEYGGSDRIELFDFHVDWVTPANSTFSGPTSLTTAPFDSAVCGFFSSGCVPQPGTPVLLDPINEWPMWRLQYRNFGTYETLVGNFTVDANGSDHAAIHWFELRKTGGGAWSIFQEATYSPDTGVHRWMASAAMDSAGNIALGYSASDGSTVFPGIRYAGRLSTDPLGTMPHGEVTLIGGAAAQTGSSRWGDYSSMNVDPTDDCTFWYTNEYTGGDGIWRTRIGAFRFPSCTDSDGDGCTDMEELGEDENFGGRRDPTNPYDFFDVPLPPGDPGTGTKSGSVTITDITGVIAKFGTFDGGPPNEQGQNYNPDFDRTLKGPNPWNLGPPSGAVNINDIVNVIAQFGHSCAAPP